MAQGGEEEYGIMKTWVSQAENAEGIPKRLYTENASAEEIIELLKAKESCFSCSNILQGFLLHQRFNYFG